MWILAAIVALAIYSFLLYRFPPKWSEEAGNWSRISLVSTIASFVVLGVAFLIELHTLDNVRLASFVAFVYSVVTYCFVQSCYTDPKLRLVDRRMLWGAILLVGAVNGYQLWLTNDSIMSTSVAIWTAVSFALILLPGLVGASDARALMIIGLAFMPILGFENFRWAIIVFFASMMVYMVYKALSTPKDAKNRIWHVLTSRTSVPAVPFILGPALAVAFFTTLTNLVSTL